MTKEEIVQYEEELNNYIVSCNQGISDIGELSRIIEDECVIMIPNSESSGIITLGPKSSSFKAGNICYDLRGAITKTLEWAASTNKPDSPGSVAKVCILTALWVVKLVKIEISDNDADFVYWMHCNNLYGNYRNEDDLVEEYQTYYHANKGRDCEKSSITDSINRLYQIKCLDIVDGKVHLCEKVWGKR